MPEALALTLAAAALLVTLGAAALRPAWLPEAAAALGGAVLLVVLGAISFRSARHSLAALGPTVGFLAALMILAEGCREAGLFEALGEALARGARGSAERLLGAVFISAAMVTAVLGLDPTVLLLTPIVFVTAARLQTSPKPHLYACSHLANSGSLLLAISNLTNLLALQSSHLSFTHFAALMALPWVSVIGIEWIVLRRYFADELGHAEQPSEGPPAGPPAVNRYAIAVLALTLAGFAVSSPLRVAPVWFAAAGAAAMTVPAIVRRSSRIRDLVLAAQPGFLLFVLGLGVIVAAAAHNGLDSAAHAVLPSGGSLPDLLGIAAISAVLANLVNNLPATLILLPVAASLGTVPVLAMLVGVNIGPNLSYAGSLATLLWRRVLHVRDTDVGLGEFTLLGILTVPPAIVAATVLLWLGARLWG